MFYHKILFDTQFNSNRGIKKGQFLSFSDCVRLILCIFGTYLRQYIFHKVKWLLISRNIYQFIFGFFSVRLVVCFIIIIIRIVVFSTYGRKFTDRKGVVFFCVYTKTVHISKRHFKHVLWTFYVSKTLKCSLEICAVSRYLLSP